MFLEEEKNYKIRNTDTQNQTKAATEAHRQNPYYPRIPHLPRQALCKIRLRLRARAPPVTPHRRRRDRELHRGHAVLELRGEYFAGDHGGLDEEEGRVLAEGGGGDGLGG